MTYLDSGNGRIVAIFSGFAESSGQRAERPAELMQIRFSVRDGTQGLFSDVTLSDVQFGAPDGVSDLSVANPVSTVNGMVRVMASDASAARLEEPFTVWPKTALKNLSLGVGDSIMASADGAAIAVSQSVTATGTVPVSAPVGGWQTGRYELLTTPTGGLSFELDGADARSGEPPDATFGFDVENGVTTYWVDVAVAGEVAIRHETDALAAETVAQIREALRSALDANPAVASVTVRGDAATIPVAADLGIAPRFDILGTTATAIYETPILDIVGFDPATGAVRIKVTPGGGNTIRSPLATGCVHVYGTSDLGERMRYISGTSFDLTPYLKDDTKGEADLTVSLGSHTFIKVKAETVVKKEGDLE